MITTGRIKALELDYETRKPILSLTINDPHVAYKEYDKLKNEEVEIRVTKARKSRSLSANAYMWVMCEALGKALNMTKLEVYREHILNVGVFQQIEINDAALPTLRKVWEDRGRGWLCEKVDSTKTEGFVLVRMYYGSSTYNTKQMARLIDNILQDCESVGVETKSREEINGLIEKWEREL